MRVLVTGGSGFIGTNLVELLCDRRIPVLNLDLAPPRDMAKRSAWARCNLLDGHDLARRACEFNPTHVVHLAARTDLRGKSVADYSVNVRGVESLINAIAACPSIERAIFTSSMLVCRPGFPSVAEDEYSPTTAYGESKVLGEKLIKAHPPQSVVWSVVRPCSIWGPWFGEPYDRFFTAVLGGRFVTFGPESAKKSFGYVGNTVYQMMRICEAPEAGVHGKTFYLGDAPPLSPGEWATAIARTAGVAPPRRVPIQAMRVAAKIGDGLAALGIDAPMTTFRFDNMTTENVVDLSPIYRIAPSPPCDLQHGIEQTLAWISERRKAA